jgi:hypothetical protein
MIGLLAPQERCGLPELEIVVFTSLGGLPAVVAGTSAGLPVASPPRPAQPVAGSSHGHGDQGGEQVLDLVAGQRDESQRWWVAGVLGDRGHLLRGHWEGERRLGGLRLLEAGEAAQWGAADDAARVKPTRSKRAWTSREYSSCPARRTKSTPEVPGPPGLRKLEPSLRAGSPAGSRISQRDLRPTRLVVVQRHPGGRALEAVAAVGPAQFGNRQGGGWRRR